MRGMIFYSYEYSNIRIFAFPSRNEEQIFSESTGIINQDKILFVNYLDFLLIASDNKYYF